MRPLPAFSLPARLWALGAALLCLLGGLVPAGAWSAALPGPGSRAAGAAVTEVVQRPFPLLVPLSYRWARGAAWMSALMAACPEFPAAARRGLAASGLDDRAGRLALCARMHRLDHLTPDDSPDMAVAVRLVPASAEARAGALREEDLLAVERALLGDLEATLLAVRSDWPSSLAEARTRAAALDAASLRLEALWRALAAVQASTGPWACGPEALDALERAAQGAPDNAALWLLLAEARLQRDLPQGAVASASRVLELIAAGGTKHPADARLAARARYVRGLAHWRLGQPALAEADLDAALHGTGAEGAPDDTERAHRLRARAAVRLARHNAAGMCADLAAACALGDCEGLAVARSRGQCRGAPAGSGEGAAP